MTAHKKSNQWIVLLASLILSHHAVYAASQSQPPADLATGFNSITQEEIKNDLFYLTSDELNGRLSLTQGDSQAINWIAFQFKQAGLKPGNGASYLQPVPLVQFYPNSKKTYVSLTRDGKRIKWKKPDILLEFPKTVDIKGELVFAGYGITAPDLNYDDYQSIDVKGKIVLVFEHEPQENDDLSKFNGKANTLHATNRMKVLNAQQHGAIAVIVAPEPNRKHPSNIQRYTRLMGELEKAHKLPSQDLVDSNIHIPVAVVSDDIANEMAGDKTWLSTLQTQLDKTLLPQSQSVKNVQVSVHSENKSLVHGTTYNVAGLLEGDDAALKSETIIISGHHDHNGSDTKNHIWRGADDNASGTVGVVTVANAFGKNVAATNSVKPKRSLLFVVFAAEERGLLGAYYMAAHPLRPLDTTRAMINFDMIGRDEKPSPQTDGLINIPKDTSNRLNLIGGHYSPDLLKSIHQQNQHVGLTLDDRFDNETALNVFFRSDQLPFIMHDIPAFWWFTGFHPDYHHITDTADKIDYAKMARILKLAYLTGYQLANEATPPGFVKNPKGVKTSS